MDVCIGDGLELGKELTDEAICVFEEAIGSLPVMEHGERAYVRGLAGRIKRGELGIYTLSARCHMVGVICYRLIDGDAELVFGNTLAGSDVDEGYFLQRIVNDLFSVGAHTIRSGFTWPHAANFISAAVRMGFSMTDRIGMVRGTSLTVQNIADSGFELSPWEDACLDDVCRIMCSHYAPSDRRVYPALTKEDGARALLQSVLEGRHGQFLSRLSTVARVEGRIVGFMLATLLLDGSVLVLNIAVDTGHRGKGIGSAMMRRLIEESAREGKKQIVLAVTSSNENAIRIYERLGFRQNMAFKQYVLSRY